MSQSTLSYPLALTEQEPMAQPKHQKITTDQEFSAALATVMTKAASSQTYLTIRHLVDRPLIADAYRAYAYFRWVDDMLDDVLTSQSDRLAFLARQQDVLAHGYQGIAPDDLCAEEQMVTDLITNHPAPSSGLRTYIDQMMAVMAFDVQRKGKMISLTELNNYTQALATAVTEALHYFIGHDEASPQGELRYYAVTGAHITHMLRDAIEDTAVGYINIPEDYLQANGITPTDFHHEAYKVWVHSRVQLARHYFEMGRNCVRQVQNLRCRMAGYAYIARFEVVLDAIEKDDYILRPAYPERKSKSAMLKMGWATLTQTLRSIFWQKRYGFLLEQSM